MKEKRVKETSVIMSQLMCLQDTNIAGNVQGWVIMKLIDTIAGVAAIRHARLNAVTAAMSIFWPFPASAVTSALPATRNGWWNSGNDYAVMHSNNFPTGILSSASRRC
jgi:hypothetical protein